MIKSRKYGSADYSACTEVTAATTTLRVKKKPRYTKDSNSHALAGLQILTEAFFFLTDKLAQPDLLSFVVVR